MDESSLVRINLGSLYEEVYAPERPLCIEGVTLSKEADPRATIALRVNDKGLSHILYAEDGGDFRTAEGNLVNTSPFARDDNRQERSIELRALRSDGTEEVSYRINVQFFPAAFFSKRGAEGYTDILRVSSAPLLDFYGGHPGEWITPPPTPEEREYAAAKWGPLLAGVESDYDKAKVLAIALMEDLFPHDGVPSDVMKEMPPFEQYERMMAGLDKGFCVNFSLIFIAACNALGITARRIHMHQTLSKSADCSLQTGSMHSSTEIFDRRLNHWVWMDTRFYALGAFLGEEGPLTLGELHLFLNQERRRERLRVLIYDMETKSQRLLPLDECPKQAFECFSGWGREFVYYRNEELKAE